MKAKAVVCFVFLCVFVAGAKDVKVRKAWTRTFPNVSLQIISDNLGHVLAYGGDTNGAFALLLNSDGRSIAKAAIPIPGPAYAAADSSGRLFFSGNVHPEVTIHCTAFGPLLSGPLWILNNNVGYDFPPPELWSTLGPISADQSGGAFVMGDWQRGLFMSHFGQDGSEVQAIYEPFSTPDRSAAAIAQAPNGDTFFVANAVDYRSTFITVTKWNPHTAVLAFYGRPSPGINGNAWARSAACDAGGNLIIVGSQYEYLGVDASRRGRCFTAKLDSNGTVLWEKPYGLHGPATYEVGPAGLGVAVDQSDNIIMTGTEGTVKYSPDGEVIWEAPEWGSGLHLDLFGNVLLTKAEVGAKGRSESQIIKLNADGTLRWQTRFSPKRSSDSSLSGIVLDQDGNVYLAARSAKGSTIVKFVERRHGNDKDRR